MGMVRHMAEWVKRDPSEATEEDVRSFFVDLTTTRQWKAQSVRQARAALGLFYREVLGHDWKVFETIKTKDKFVLPVVLTRDEVALLFSLVREPRFRVPIQLAYECGLRLSEVIKIEVSDIERKKGEAGRLRVRQGKGGKDRYVPLSAAMIADLEWWWLQHRHQHFLFPSFGYAWKRATRKGNSEAQQREQAALMRAATTHIGESTLQNAFHQVVIESRLKKKITLHTLRHSYATHLMEEGVPVRLVSQYLGHATLDQTMVYLHLTAVSEEHTQQALLRMRSAVGNGTPGSPPTAPVPKPGERCACCGMLRPQASPAF